MVDQCYKIGNVYTALIVAIQITLAETFNLGNFHPAALHKVHQIRYINVFVWVAVDVANYTFTAAFYIGYGETVRAV